MAISGEPSNGHSATNSGRHLMTTYRLFSPIWVIWTTKIMLYKPMFGRQSKITFVGGNFGLSKTMLIEREFGRLISCFTIVNLLAVFYSLKLWFTKITWNVILYLDTRQTINWTVLNSEYGSWLWMVKNYDRGT